MFAEAYDIDSALFNKLMDDPEQSGISTKLLPVLAYVKKLTETPAKMTDEDAEAVYNAGVRNRGDGMRIR